MKDQDIPRLTPDRAKEETEKIISFLQQHLNPDGKAVIGLSGGIDADVAARLTCRAIGPDRLKLFIAIQAGLENKYIINARNTAAELGTHLAEIDLSHLSLPFLSALADADSLSNFRPEGLLDPAHIKSSLRTSVFSMYVERGYLVVGTSNKTEYDLGFFLPLGDGAWHLGPLAHLYKTQIFDLARYLGTAESVIRQQPSGGFWPGETDLEDIAFWLVYGEPVQKDVNWTPEDMAAFARLHRFLTFPVIDAVLAHFSRESDDAKIAGSLEIDKEIVSRMRLLVRRAGCVKKRLLRQTVE
ncbi:MAG: NH(3)-dependent NAD(+) synthetase [Smithella sp. PtaU1.Bin162]|nr:MAG: NH(3)-dependent NAD(+) synthetase [Smithella sp. PtaU1.Bin162]